MTPGAGPEARTELWLADGRVADGPPEPGTPVTRLDAAGCVVTPGLVNAHHHLLQCAFRTLPGTSGVPMAVWLERMAAAYRAAGTDPELGLLAARVGLAEAALCGVTTVADHHLTWPAGVDPVEMAASAFDAAGGLGVRLCFVRGTAGDDPQAAAASVEAIHAVCVGGGGSGGVSADGMRQLAVGPSGAHADGPETFSSLAAVAATLGLRRRTQCGEQVDVERALQKYGRRPLELLAEWGWLGPDVTLAHFCEPAAGELETLAASGATVTHAPACDLPMAWGIAPVARLVDAGVRVGLGTSGGGSNDAGHLLADARLAMQVAPLVGRALEARELFTAGTAGSADGLGRGELGRLEPGSVADVAVWDVGGVADAGVADPVAGLLWAAPGRRPRDVLVAGREVVRDGRLVTADERAVAADLRRACRERGIGRPG